MHIIIKKHLIESDKLANDIKIVNTADYHYSNISSRSKFIIVRDSIKNIKPDYISISGDYIDMPEILENPIRYEESLIYIEQLSRIAKVIMSIGSHEYMLKKGGAYYNTNWFNDIDSIPNVELLNNKRFIDGDINFYGYTPTRRYYYNKTGFEDENELIKDFCNKMPEIDNELYNVLLCHSPIKILNPKVLEEIIGLKNVDLVLSGHMHNGMLPNFMNDLIKGNKGFIAPNKKLFPDNARGMISRKIDDKEIYMNVTGGVTKIQETAPKILHFVDKLYQPQIDYIHIKGIK